MIVRLKVPYHKNDFEKLKKFQFYDSPIKRPEFCKLIGVSSKFQFYDSPIKSSKNVRFLKRKKQFQFYDSPIKSYY